MAEAASLLLSVVIPTHNRRDSLLRTLDALRGQTVGPRAFEVIVVIDAGTDDTAEKLDRQSWPFALHHAAAVGRGPSWARNTGAAMARGERVVFLDDDIVADPGFLAAHLDAALRVPGAAVVGQSAPAVTATGWFGKAITDWWTARFRAMAAPGHRFGHTDVMSGNLSVPRDLFAAMGGFDTTLQCREDYELGYRLVQDGVRIVYAPVARGLHHDASTPARNLSRAWNEGIADAQIAVKHPALFPWLRSANMTAPTKGALVLRQLCFRAPGAGRAALRVATPLASILEKLRLYRAWERLTSLSRALSYQLGVAVQVGEFATLEAARQGSLARPTLPRAADIDLLDGVGIARAAMAATSPDALTLRVGDRIIARRHAEPGLEPLARRHLDAILAQEVWHWAIHAEAADVLPQLPNDTPAWAARTVDQSSGNSVRLAELDLTDWMLTDRSDDMGFPLKVLVRDGRHPLGWAWFEAPPPEGTFWPALRRAVLADHGICQRLIRTRWIVRPEPAHLPISVVVCTRDRTDTLRRCLMALRNLDHPDPDIVIVDNAPSGTDTRDLIAAMPGIRYVREDRPGLDWARNRGVAEARHDIIAITDDDTCADHQWLTGFASVFADPSVDFVTGLVVPMKLDTEARLYFEDVYGGMGKGFDAVTRDPAAMWPNDLLWSSALGVGANMAFRRRAFDKAGRFDPALDVGTATRGGGDIEMFHRALARGCVHAYEPSAFVWHEHRADFDGLRRQLADNGSGFASYLLACLRNRTVPRMAVARFALRAWLWNWQVKRLIRPGRHKRDFVRAEITGLLRAPRLWRVAQERARALETLPPQAPSGPRP